MTKLIVCLLLVDGNQKEEEIQQLLRTSMPIQTLPIQESAFIQASSMQEMWNAVAIATRSAADSTAVATPSSSSVSSSASSSTPGTSAGEMLLHIYELTIDKARHIVKVGQEKLHLTPTEYDLLCLLASQPGALFSHEQLQQQVWGESTIDTLHLLRVNISNLRRKLTQKFTGKATGNGDHKKIDALNSPLNGTPNGNDAGEYYIKPSAPQYIITEPGIGYRLRAD